ncbi:MAG: transglycosylase domain-containing protein, partial [Patescibacteria group bacterium]
KQKDIKSQTVNLLVRVFSPIGRVIILCFSMLFSTLRIGATLIAHVFFVAQKHGHVAHKKTAKTMRNFVQILRKVFLTLGHTAQALLSSQMKLFAAIRHPKKNEHPLFQNIHISSLKLNLPHIHFPSFSFTLWPSPLKNIVTTVQTHYASPEFRQTQSFISGIILTILFIFLPYNAYQWVMSLPNPELLSRRDLEVTTKIFDRNGSLLYEIYADQNRTPIRLSDIPDSMKQATIAIEDKEFYQHQGFSIKGMIRAGREMFTNKRVVQGGSTITQQLIKSALLSPDVSVIRKIKEIVLAFWAERLYTKNQILEMYLNQVPYGGTAWGVEAASRTYFGKPMKDLTLAETSLLAGLPAAPSDYSPYGSHPEKAFDRQAEVLRRMAEDRYITKAQVKEALAQELHFVPPRISIRAPHFVMYVKELLEKRYGPRLVEKGGLRIITSLDIGMQEKVQEIVRKQIEGLKYLRVGNGGAVVSNPKTGEILAMVGSKDYFNTPDQGNVNVTTSQRQPGSAIKVVNYAAALENGFTASTVIDDSPITYQIAGSIPYSPVNYDSKFHGATPFRYALGNSYNIPAVKILAKIGLKTMIEKGRLMGIESWEDESRYGLSLTLGGGEVTMIEMAKVFGTLANQGRRHDILPILEVTDYTGKVIERNVPGNGVKALTPETAWIMGNILADNNARTAAFGPSSSLVIPGKTVSVKTGTSNDKRDNWTVGYTPSIVTTVWVGNNDNSPMDPYLTSGITGAAPIWHDIMVELLKDKQDEVPLRPDTIISLPCYFDRPEYYVRGTEPAGGRCAPLPTPTPSPSPTP